MYGGADRKIGDGAAAFTGAVGLAQCHRSNLLGFRTAFEIIRILLDHCIRCV